MHQTIRKFALWFSSEKKKVQNKGKFKVRMFELKPTCSGIVEETGVKSNPECIEAKDVLYCVE